MEYIDEMIFGFIAVFLQSFSFPVEFHSFEICFIFFNKSLVFRYQVLGRPNNAHGDTGEYGAKFLQEYKFNISCWFKHEREISENYKFKSFYKNKKGVIITVFE